MQVSSIILYTSLSAPSFLSTNPHVYMSDHANFKIEKSETFTKSSLKLKSLCRSAIPVWKWEIESHLVAICKTFSLSFCWEKYVLNAKKCHFPLYKVRKGLWSVFPWKMLYRCWIAMSKYRVLMLWSVNEE